MKTLLGEQKLQRLVTYVRLSNHIEGSIAEIGVYKGGSAMSIARNKREDKRLFLFDTFDGLPQECEKDNHHKKGDFADTSLESVREGLKNFDNVYIHKGLFPHETGTAIWNEVFSLVHIDVDLYKSYVDTLNFIWSRVVKGGIVVMDDYNASTCLGAKLAVDEFFYDKREALIWSCMSQICAVKGSEAHIPFRML